MTRRNGFWGWFIAHEKDNSRCVCNKCYNERMDILDRKTKDLLVTMANEMIDQARKAGLLND